MKRILSFLLLSTILLLSSCGTTKSVPVMDTPRELAKFDYSPPFQNTVGSLDMTIAIVKPVFITEKPEFLVSPFPEMATSMSNDFEEMLTSKGFTIKGPFNTRGEMVYSEKMNSSFILEIEIDLNPLYNIEFEPVFNKKPLANVLLGETGWSYKPKGTITFGGKLILTALSPQYGEKIWKKNISLNKITFNFSGEKPSYSRTDMATLLAKDNQIYNTISKELSKFYNYSLDLVWRQIDPAEMKQITEQAKEADAKSR